jgi:hypothetical protein
MTYMFDGKQYIAVARGSAILAFGLSGIELYSEANTADSAPRARATPLSRLARGAMR